jgi:hypothetical protein
MANWGINKSVAPKGWTDFKRWYPLACNLPNVSAEEAFKSLGYKLPTDDDDKPVKKKLKSDSRKS